MGVCGIGDEGARCESCCGFWKTATKETGRESADVPDIGTMPFKNTLMDLTGATDMPFACSKHETDRGLRLYSRRL